MRWADDRGLVHHTDGSGERPAASAAPGPSSSSREPDPVAFTMAGDAGLLVDGDAVYETLALATEEIERLERLCGIVAHVDGASGGEHKQGSKWFSVRASDGAGKVWRNALEPDVFEYLRARLGRADLSALIGDGVGNGLLGRGHGADPQRKLVDPIPFFDSLFADRVSKYGHGRRQVIEIVRAELARRERTDDYVRRAIERKRLGGASYNTIDAFRPEFLVKHPSRGQMRAEDKRLIAYIYAHRMAAGERVRVRG